MATSEEIKLLEKITRAKVRLEGAIKNHASNCMVESDPDYTGPCTCGASDCNILVRAALMELS